MLGARHVTPIPSVTRRGGVIVLPPEPTGRLVPSSSAPAGEMELHGELKPLDLPHVAPSSTLYSSRHHSQYEAPVEVASLGVVLELPERQGQEELGRTRQDLMADAYTSSLARSRGGASKGACARRLSRTRPEAQGSSSTASPARSSTKSAHVKRLSAEVEVACCMVMQRYHKAQAYSSAPQMDPEEMEKLKEASTTAQALLLRNHEPYVMSHARRFGKNYKVNIGDLKIAGQLALIEAALRYKPGKGAAKLLTFAQMYILNGIMGAVRDSHTKVLYVPRYMYDIQKKVHTARQELKDAHQQSTKSTNPTLGAAYEPTPQQIAARSNISVKAVRDFLSVEKLRVDVAVETGERREKDGSGSNATRGMLDLSGLVDESTEDVKLETEQEISKEAVSSLLSEVLSKKECETIMLMLELERKLGRPLGKAGKEKVGAELGLSRQGVINRVQNAYIKLEKDCKSNPKLVSSMEEAVQAFNQ